MDYSSLNDQEIKALLMQYDSEMRKLSFQMQVIQTTIQKLHESLNTSTTENQIISATGNKFEIQDEELATPKIIAGVEYPKKRSAKIDLSDNNTVETKERKKPGPKPKNSVEVPNEEKVGKKRGPKPKLKADTEIVKERKKPGPKPKAQSFELSVTTKERRKPGPKPKAKDNSVLANKASKKRGRKSKSNTNTNVEQLNSTKDKKKLRSDSNSKRKYTKENPWPEFVLSTLSKYSHLMNSAQLYELADEENTLKNYALDVKEVRSMISRALHQLSNNKRAIVKFDIKGSKSYNYGLTDWMNENGEINEQYLP